MTLLITIVAAVIATAVWYTNEKAREIKIGVLCYLYWGASIMWLVDAIFEYVELRAEYFAPALEDMINDTFLGFSVVALGLIIWTVVYLVKDPRGVVKKSISRK